MNNLEQGARFSDAGLARILEQLRTSAAVSLEMLGGAVLDELTLAASGLSFRPARSEVGKPEARVYQEFGYCGAVPDDHPLWNLARWVQARVKRALAVMADPPLHGDFEINDVVCQRYLPGQLGITPHRDHASYTRLIILVILSGAGRYCVCADRQGNAKREIRSGPGWAILMPGPGYAGRTDRPFHMVGGISRLRYSVGLRHDVRKTAPKAAPPREFQDYPQIL